MVLAIAFALVMSIGLVIGCEEEEDDDEDDDATTADDDSTDTCLYEDEISWAYNSCGLVLVDENDADMTLAEALEDCNTCVGTCAAGYMDADDCDALGDCLTQNCF